MTTSAKISAFIVEQLLDGETEIDVEHEENLLMTGVIDSLGVMRLVAWLELEFGLAIAPEDVTLENFMNVQAMSAYLSSKTG